MRTIIALVVVGTLAVGTHRMLAAGQSSNGKCADLMSLRLPDLKVSEAVAVPAASTGAIRAAHCRVNGVIGTEIRFSLLLPDNWNRKFFMGGGGGFVGSIQNSAQSTVNEGYATAGTDTGHQGNGTDASWAHNNLERQLNFGYLAVHRTAEMAKAIVASYYGRPAARNYFQGCSRGGGQALMEAQRFPDDFDGIIAGAPAYDWTGIAAQMLRNMQALFPDPNKIDADVHAGHAEDRRNDDRRELRQARRRQGRRHRRSAAVQVQRRHAAADAGAEERTQGDLRTDDESRR